MALLYHFRRYPATLCITPTGLSHLDRRMPSVPKKSTTAQRKEGIGERAPDASAGKMELNFSHGVPNFPTFSRFCPQITSIRIWGAATNPGFFQFLSQTAPLCPIPAFLCTGRLGPASLRRHTDQPQDDLHKERQTNSTHMFQFYESYTTHGKGQMSSGKVAERVRAVVRSSVVAGEGATVWPASPLGLCL